MRMEMKEMMRMDMNEIKTEKIVNALWMNDICPVCGSRGLEYIDDPDCMASEYTRVMQCETCDEEISFYGAVVWSSIETSGSTLDMPKSYEGSKLELARKNAIKKADEMRRHMIEIGLELESYVTSHADCYDRLDYEPFSKDDLLDEESFLIACQLFRHRSRETGEIPEEITKDFYHSKGIFAKGERDERAHSVDRFYELQGHHTDRARGHAWLPDLMGAYIDQAIELGASMPTELFVEHIWFYIANEGVLDEYWLDDEERVEVLRNNVLPLARFLLDRDTEFAYNHLHAYNESKAEMVSKETKKISDIVHNITAELAELEVKA